MTILAFKTFEVGDAVSAASGGTFSGAVTFNAGLVANTVDINGGTIDGLTGLALSGNITMDDDTFIGISDSDERIEFSPDGDIAVLGANLGIGTDEPTGYPSAQNNLVIEGTGDEGMSIISGTSSDSTIGFGDGVGSGSFRGMIAYHNTDDAMTFRTSATEKMRITSSGDLETSTTGKIKQKGAFMQSSTHQALTLGY